MKFFQENYNIQQPAGVILQEMPPKQTRFDALMMSDGVRCTTTTTKMSTSSLAHSPSHADSQSSTLLSPPTSNPCPFHACASSWSSSSSSSSSDSPNISTASQQQQQHQLQQQSSSSSLQSSNPQRWRQSQRQRQTKFFHGSTAGLSNLLVQLYICFLTVTAGASSSTATTATRRSTTTLDERTILEALYVATDGDHWKNKDNWMSTATNTANGDDDISICNWYGITCDATTKQVIAVDLKQNNLNGVIPPAFWQLPSLTQVNMRNNLLTSASFSDLANVNNNNNTESPSQHYMLAPIESIVLAENHLTTLQGIGYASQTLQNLDINKNQIETTLPEELFACLHLETLYFAFNQFHGTIPTLIGRLTKLNEVYAFDNRLTGTLPTEFGLLDQMRVLGLGNNAFTGTFPTQMEQMINLRDLSIHQLTGSSNSNSGTGSSSSPNDNSLSQSPPSQSSSNTGLVGPLPTFGDMPYLSLLFLDGNSFSGSIPSDFLRHNVQTMEPVSIGITNNLLTGTIPKSLERFEALSIDIVGNQITEIPEELCDKGGWMGGLVEEFKCDAILCPLGTYNLLGRAFGTNNPCLPCDNNSNNVDNSTTMLYLGATTCDTGIQEEQDTWKILGDFYLAMSGGKWTLRDGWETFDNLLAGGTIQDLENLGIDICDGWYGIVCDDKGNVTDISLSNNELFGTVPNSIFTISSLQSVDLSNNNVLLSSLEGASKAPSLTSLILSNVKIPSVAGLRDLTNLEHLFLDGVNILEPLPMDIFSLTNLKTLHLQHSQFTGTLPTDIGKLTRLQNLNMYRNFLRGPLPTELGLLTLLRTLDLSENHFTGSIPSEIDSLSDLEVFALHQTSGEANLSGPLPAFDSFSQLKELSLESNSLTGSIPSNFLARISDKTSEIMVSLGFNQLQGTIPASLNAFDALILELEGNQITG